MTTPAPERARICWEFAKDTVPPAFTVTRELDASALPPERMRLPALTMVAPVKVLTPASVKTPVVDFVRPAPPAKVPVTNPLWAKIVPEVTEKLPF